VLRVVTALVPGTTLVRLVGSWDGVIWRSVVDDGYPASLRDPLARNLAFFPLFPAIGRVVAHLTGRGSLMVAAAVGTGCFLLSTTLTAP
jgi:hypothetical protein